MYQNLRDHLQKSGLFDAAAFTQMQIKPLATGTSEVFLITAPGHPAYVVKIPLPALQQLINRDNEYQANQTAAKLGISLPYCYFNFTSGISVTEYQSECQILNKSLMQQGNIWKKVIELLKTVHCLPNLFIQDFDIFSVIKNYRNKVNKNNLPSELSDLYSFNSAIDKIEQQFKDLAIPPQPCHGDPTLENFLLVADRLYLIDWEYAGNNDPCWDLATVAMEAEFNAEQEKALLSYYFQELPDAAILQRFQVYKVLANYLWALWCEVLSLHHFAIQRWQQFKNEFPTLFSRVC